MSDGLLPSLLFLVPAVGVLLLATVAVLGVRRYRSDQARRLGLFAFAEQRGWAYHGVDPGDLPARWTVRPFGQGEDRRAAVVVSGVWAGRRFVAFDYTFTTTTSADDPGAGDTVTWRHRVTALPMPGSLPGLRICRAGLGGRVASALGGEDIELESEEFNQRYRLRCPDRKLATDVVTPRTMAALLRVGHPGELVAAGTDLLAVDRGEHTPETLLRDLAALSAVVDGVPGFVWAGRR